MLKKAKSEQFPKNSTEAASEPSKTQIKQQMLAITDLGKTLCQMPPDRVKKAPLSENVLEQVSEYHRCKSFGAKKRQINYIGKLLREEPVEELQAWIEGSSLPQKLETLNMHAAEKWREALINDPNALQDLINAYPQAATLNLNQRIRQAQHERKLQKTPKNYRQIYKLIYDLIKKSNSEEGML